MKRIVCALTVLMTASLAFGGYALYVPMEQGTGTDVEDLGPGLYTGVNQGNVGWASDPNRGTVLDFADVGDNGNSAVHGLVFTGYKGVLGDAPRSISLWIKTTWAAQNLCLWGPMATANETFMVNMETGQIRVQNWAGMSKTVLANTLNDDRWHHVVVVVPDSGLINIHTVQIYVDNRLVPEAEMTRGGAGGVINTTAGLDLRIGDDGGDNAFRDYTGLMDDFRIYDVSLTAEQVDAIHHEYIQMVSPGVSEWVDVEADLGWGATALANPTSWDLYFDTSEAAVTARSIAPIVTTETSYDPGLMPTATRYYWRVDAQGTDPVTGDPAVIESPVWSFQTEPPVPVITTEPVDQLAKPGEAAVFTVAADYTDGYTWYREPAEMLADGATGSGSVISGATTSSLTISNISVADEGMYYVVASRTGEAQTATSDSAQLFAKRVVGYWTMDDPQLTGDPNNPMADQSGHGNDLTIYNDVAFVDGVDGTVRGAAWFDGVDDKILGENPAMAGIPVQDEPFTVSAYVYVEGANSLGTAQPIVAWGEGFVGEVAADTSHRVEVVRIVPSLAGVQEMWWDADNAYTLSFERDGFTEFPGRWVHVATTFDHLTRERHIYINGSLVDTKDEPEAHQLLTTENFGIGYAKNENFLNDTAFPFHGAIDEVRIYNYAVSQTEVAQEYYDVTGRAACLDAVEYDINGDCVFGLYDLTEITQHWLECNLVPGCE